MDDKQRIYEKNRKNGEALSFRVDQRTYLELTKIAEQRGISRSEVCRERLAGLIYQPPLFEKNDADELRRQLVRIGTNLNQATKKLNFLENLYHKKVDLLIDSGKKTTLGSKKELFYQEYLNEIARKLRVNSAQDFYSEGVFDTFEFRMLSSEQKTIMEQFRSGERKRVETKPELEMRILRELREAIDLIHSMSEERDRLCQLV